MDVLIYLILFFAGKDFSRAPAPEVPALVKKLGDDEWKVREDAQAKLEKMGPEIHVALEETIKKDKDLERVRRCQRILPKVMNVCSDYKDNYLPAIWSLPNVIRFPKGYKYNPENTTEWSTDQDIAKTYYLKARTLHNKTARISIPDSEWRDYWVEREAMQMFMRDLRIKGVPMKVCKRILNWSVDIDKRYYLIYNYEKPPGPAVINDSSYGYQNGCYVYYPPHPDGNWKKPHTIGKWVLKVKEWPTPQSVWYKIFPPEPCPMYKGHPGP